MDTPRTLILDLAKRYGGISSRVLKLTELIDEVALGSLTGSAVTRAAEAQGLPHFTLGPRKTDPRLIPRLLNVVDGQGIQVIDTQNVQSKFWGSIAAARADIALISTLNSWYAAEFGDSLKGRFYDRVEFTTNTKLDLYIVVSSVDRDRLIERGIPADYIELILNAVDIHPQDVTAMPDLRSRFGLPADAVVCSAVGRLVWQKGYPDMVDAFAQIASDLPRLHCLVMGEGQMEDEIRALITANGLEGRIKLIGYQEREDVLAIVKASDFFLMPSRYEGTPVALLEAAALAKPIVASTAGGIPDLVNDGQQALLSPVQDSAALAANLRRICTDEALAERLGHAAREHILTHFSPHAQAQATRAAYRKAWERRQERMD